MSSGKPLTSIRFRGLARTRAPRVAIVRCKGYHPTQVRSGLEQALEYLGGIASFIKPAHKVLVKPNLFAAVSPHRGLTTHPELVRALCTLIEEHGAQAHVGDNPVFGLTRLTYHRTGMRHAMSGTKGRLVDLSTTVSYDVPHGRVLRKVLMSKDLPHYDRVISLPKLKSHQLMGLTGAVKNSYGLVHGLGIRKRFHLLFPDPLDFALMLLDVSDLVDPELFIVDAVVASDGNGPRFGSPREVGYIIAGTDAVAVDLVLCSIVGLPFERVWTLRAALMEREWCGKDPLSRIHMSGVPIQDAYCRDFVPPPEQGGLISALPSPIRAALVRYSKRSRMSPYESSRLR